MTSYTHNTQVWIYHKRTIFVPCSLHLVGGGRHAPRKLLRERPVQELILERRARLWDRISREAVSENRFSVECRGLLRRPGPFYRITEVHIVHAEPLRVATCPFEVIKQRPGGVAFYVHVVHVDCCVEDKRE